MNNKLMLGLLALLAVIVVAYAVTMTNRTAAPEATEEVDQEPHVVDMEELEGTEYRLVSHNDVLVPEEATYTISFEDGSVFAKVCNNMFGEVTVSGTVMQGMVASTLMYCSAPEGVMEVESALQNMLHAGADVSLSGDELILEGEGNTLLFTAS